MKKILGFIALSALVTSCSSIKDERHIASEDTIIFNGDYRGFDRIPTKEAEAFDGMYTNWLGWYQLESGSSQCFQVFHMYLSSKSSVVFHFTDANEKSHDYLGVYLLGIGKGLEKHAFKPFKEDNNFFYIRSDVVANFKNNILSYSENKIKKIAKDENDISFDGEIVSQEDYSFEVDLSKSGLIKFSFDGFEKELVAKKTRMSCYYKFKKEF